MTSNIINGFGKSNIFLIAFLIVLQIIGGSVPVIVECLLYLKKWLETVFLFHSLSFCHFHYLREKSNLLRLNIYMIIVLHELLPAEIYQIFVGIALVEWLIELLEKLILHLLLLFLGQSVHHEMNDIRQLWRATEMYWQFQFLWLNEINRDCGCTKTV